MQKLPKFLYWIDPNWTCYGVLLKTDLSFLKETTWASFKFDIIYKVYVECIPYLVYSNMKRVITIMNQLFELCWIEALRQRNLEQTKIHPIFKQTCMSQAFCTCRDIAFLKQNILFFSSCIREKVIFFSPLSLQLSLLYGAMFH